MMKIIDDNDTSYWAKMAINHCTWLLQNGVRWPDKLNGIRNNGVHRSQTGLTRDPFWYVVCADMILNSSSVAAKKLKLPAKIWIPAYSAFRKYMITGRRIYLKLYHILTPKSNKDYVQQMHRYRDMAIKKRRE